MEIEDLILKKKQLEDSIIEVVNNADLPAFIVKPIFIDILQQVTIQEKQQMQQALLKKEEMKKDEKK